MEIPKPSEEDKQFFRSVLPDDPEVEVKPMFGNLSGTAGPASSSPAKSGSGGYGYRRRLLAAVP